MRTQTIVASSAAGLALLLAGCSGDPGAAHCEPTNLVMTLDGTERVLTNAVAVTAGGGSTVTTFVTDREFTMDSFNAWTFSREIAEGENLATLSITTFNATGDPEKVATGAEVVPNAGAGAMTLVVVGQVGQQPYGNAMNSEGLLSVKNLGSIFCFEVDYRDDEKTVVGTVTAVVAP